MLPAMLPLASGSSGSLSDFSDSDRSLSNSPKSSLSTVDPKDPALTLEALFDACQRSIESPFDMELKQYAFRKMCEGLRAKMRVVNLNVIFSYLEKAVSLFGDEKEEVTEVSFTYCEKQFFSLAYDVQPRPFFSDSFQFFDFWKTVYAKLRYEPQEDISFTICHNFCSYLASATVEPFQWSQVIETLRWCEPHFKYCSKHELFRMTFLGTYVNLYAQNPDHILAFVDFMRKIGGITHEWLSEIIKVYIVSNNRSTFPEISLEVLLNNVPLISGSRGSLIARLNFSAAKNGPSADIGIAFFRRGIDALKNCTGFLDPEVVRSLRDFFHQSVLRLKPRLVCLRLAFVQLPLRPEEIQNFITPIWGLAQREHSFQQETLGDLYDVILILGGKEGNFRWLTDHCLEILALFDNPFEPEITVLSLTTLIHLNVDYFITFMDKAHQIIDWFIADSKIAKARFHVRCIAALANEIERVDQLCNKQSSIPSQSPRMSQGIAACRALMRDMLNLGVNLFHGLSEFPELQLKVRDLISSSPALLNIFNELERLNKLKDLKGP